MNKIGIYYAYWTHDWDADFHPFVDKVADLGFDILEVNGGTIGSMNTAERKSLKAHADDKGLILTYCIGLPRQYDIASEDQSVRADGIGYLTYLGQDEYQGGYLGGLRMVAAGGSQQAPDDLAVWQLRATGHVVGLAWPMRAAEVASSRDCGNPALPRVKGCQAGDFLDVYRCGDRKPSRSIYRRQARKLA